MKGWKMNAHNNKITTWKGNFQNKNCLENIGRCENKEYDGIGSGFKYFLVLPLTNWR